MMKLSEDRMLSQVSTPPQPGVETEIVELLLNAGFHQKRIAALFDCNQGRVAEISRQIKGSTPAYEVLATLITSPAAR